ncbi:hypothetical protein JOB18_024856 [Solea senegalensis]|uniref:Uncharacterized protein n=1 Tax=Solea senegalensis TaxID=28829 RepID=A0AAV6SZJ6_SOLSE|nr:hypothetical protein JOB18_024856 [Solea senegalensis]
MLKIIKWRRSGWQQQQQQQRKRRRPSDREKEKEGATVRVHVSKSEELGTTHTGLTCFLHPDTGGQGCALHHEESFTRGAAAEEEEEKRRGRSEVVELLLQQRPGASRGETRELSSSNGGNHHKKDVRDFCPGVEPSSSAAAADVGASNCAPEIERGTPIDLPDLPPRRLCPLLLPHPEKGPK